MSRGALKNLAHRGARRHVQSMRALASSLFVALIVASCGPKVSPPPPAFDDDLDTSNSTPAAEPNELTMERSIAPPGPGARTGTIARDRLLAVLDAGPAAFLRQFEVAAKLNGERFVGWELVQLVDRQSPLSAVDLVPGDVLLAINGTQLSHPAHLQTVWEQLRTANHVTAQLWRGSTKLTLEFAIDPPIEARIEPASKL